MYVGMYVCMDSNMYVCMYVFIYVFTVCLFVCVCMFVCMYAFMYICISVCMYVCMYVCMRVYISYDSHTYIHLLMDGAEGSSHRSSVVGSVKLRVLAHRESEDIIKAAIQVRGRHH